MDILITDYYCASNRGDAAILEGVHTTLKDGFPQSNITVMTENPTAAQIVNGFDAVEQTLSGFQFNISKKNLARIYLSFSAPFIKNRISIPGFQSVNTRAKIQPYLDADLVVSTGGHFLTDIYFPGKIGVLWQYYYLTQIDTPVVIYAQTLGPFSRTLYRNLTRKVLENVELIITRDEKSKSHMNELNISTPVYVTADAAFSMDVDSPKDVPITSLQPRNELADLEENTVSISVREWSYLDKIAIEDYAIAIAEVADWLVEEQNMNILFASTCTGLAGYHKDDRLFAARVIDRMDNDDRDKVRVLTGEYTPRQLVDIYDRMCFHIGMRMHSNILAMMAETPIVAIQYQFKTEELMAMFNLEEYWIDIEDVSTETLKTLVTKGLQDRGEITETIQQNLPQIIERSDESAQLIKKHLFVDKTMKHTSKV